MGIDLRLEDERGERLADLPDPGHRVTVGSSQRVMKIEHSPLLNDFLCFYIETRVDGELRYETVIYYHPRKEYFIKDKGTVMDSELFPFEDESAVETEIRARVERLING